MDNDQIVRETQEKAESLKGQKIRVIRVVTYEGDSEGVLKQLARSLPEGVKECGGYSITVRKHSLEVIGQKKILGSGVLAFSFMKVPDEDPAVGQEREEAASKLAINSIKEIRMKSGCGLSEAKKAWDQFHDIEQAINHIKTIEAME